MGLMSERQMIKKIRGKYRHGALAIYHMAEPGSPKIVSIPGARISEYVGKFALSKHLPLTKKDITKAFAKRLPLENIYMCGLKYTTEVKLIFTKETMPSLDSPSIISAIKELVSLGYRLETHPYIYSKRRPWIVVAFYLPRNRVGIYDHDLVEVECAEWSEFSNFLQLNNALPTIIEPINSVDESS